MCETNICVFLSHQENSIPLYPLPFVSKLVALALTRMSHVIEQHLLRIILKIISSRRQRKNDWYANTIARTERDTYSTKISDIISDIVCESSTCVCTCMCACAFARQRTRRVKDAMWLKPTRYSARNVSSDLSFTFCTPFAPCSPAVSPRIAASRPPLSRVHRSHECACIRIPAVRPLNLRPLSTSRFLETTKVRKRIRCVRG